MDHILSLSYGKDSTAGDTRFRWDSIDQISCFMEV